jgi:hypothetical protein
MKPIQATPTSAYQLTALIEDLSAGLDPDFDTTFDDLEREFAELRLTFGQN